MGGAGLSHKMTIGVENGLLGGERCMFLKCVGVNRGASSRYTL